MKQESTDQTLITGKDRALAMAQLKAKIQNTPRTRPILVSPAQPRIDNIYLNGVAWLDSL